MGATSAEQMAALRRKLDLPEDATSAEVLAAADYLVAKANAKQSGTVSKDPIRAAMGISDTEPERVVHAALDTMMLRQAKILGLPASTPRRDLRVGIEAANRVAASRRQVAASQPSPPLSPAPRRVAAATERDLSGVYARNPLVAQVQVERRVYASAVEASGGSTPTLFHSGDTPAFTASGVDPSLLLSLPWVARHAAAAEPDRARVLEMFESLSGPDGPVLASEFESHQGNRDYTSRVMNWQSAGWDLAREQNEERQSQVAAAQQGHVMAALGDPDDWTDEQHYEHLFGGIDRKAEAARIDRDQAFLDGRAIGDGRDPEQVRASMEARIAASGGRTPQSTSKSIDYSEILRGDA